jgi:plastocyanin
VEIRGFAYLPATLQVAVGDTIVWINRDVVPHTATRDGQGWDSGSIGAEQPWSLVAASGGSQPYYCAFHPTMRGVLAVR